MVASGSSCERVTSKDDCELAAEELELVATTATEETVSDFPPYCYQWEDFEYEGEYSLYFNNNGSSTAICSGYSTCICKNDGTSPPPSSYDLVTSGSSCERITSKDDCELAAEELGLDDTTAGEETESDYPPYCYLTFDGDLWFNNNGDSTAECTQSSRCICKV